MKKLNVTQMENLQGGKAPCAAIKVIKDVSGFGAAFGGAIGLAIFAPVFFGMILADAIAC